MSLRLRLAGCTSGDFMCVRRICESGEPIGVKQLMLETFLADYARIPVVPWPLDEKVVEIRHCEATPNSFSIIVATDQGRLYGVTCIRRMGVTLCHPAGCGEGEVKVNVIRLGEEKGIQHQAATKPVVIRFAAPDTGEEE